MSPTGPDLGSDFLTAAQQELVDHPGSQFVEACPGSGKTRAIVARFARVAELRTRRGIALISFTNAAVDEARRRCTDPDLLGAPNFVGTFDSFINRFISGPWHASRYRQYPRFVQSWEHVPSAQFRVPGMSPGTKFLLDHFDWDDDGIYRFQASRAGGSAGNYLRSLHAGRATEVNQRAEEVRKSHTKAGVMACSASRRLAGWLLETNERSAQVRDLLAGRFEEVIVDEAQDCGREELAVLHAFVDAGIRVTAVADPDQSIFEFRRASPEKVALFADRIGRGQRLDGNFRSSPAIVAVGASLRASDLVDIAVGRERSNSLAVAVSPFDDLTEVAEMAKATIELHGLDHAAAVVLAHRGDDAATAAGAPLRPSSGGTAIAAMRRAADALAAFPDPERRRRTIEAVERRLLDVVGAAPHPTIAQRAEAIGVTERFMRDAAWQLCLGVSRTEDRATYTAAVRSGVKRLAWPSSTDLENLNRRLKTPSEAEWLTCTAVSMTTSMAAATVHSAKGQEHDIVVLVIPKRLTSDVEGRSCVELWDEGLDGESRRVLYVGATRARKLLIIAVHRKHEEVVQRCLAR